MEYTIIQQRQMELARYLQDKYPPRDGGITCEAMLKNEKETIERIGLHPRQAIRAWKVVYVDSRLLRKWIV